VKTIRSETDWHRLFNAHDQSGQSAAVFCRERGLCSKHFSKRRKQLLNSPQLSNPSKPAFVPVTMTQPVEGVRIELHLGNTLCLTLPTSISARWLADLIHELRP